jgi:hypothetical protein
MEQHPKVTPIPTEQFPATRPGIGTIAVACAAAISLVVIYYWPIITPYLGL